MLKISILADFELRSFFYEKTPAKAMVTAAVRGAHARLKAVYQKCR